MPQPRVDRWRADLHASGFRALIDTGIEALGQDEIEALLSRLGTSVAAFRDPNAWFSVELAAALVRALSSRVEDPAFLERAARAALSPKYLGILHPLFRSLGTPSFTYGRVPALARRVNKVGQFSIEARSAGHVRYAYRSLPGTPPERDDVLCRMREIQLRLGPTLFDLPPAQVTHGRCLARGDDACTYEVTWQERKRGGQIVLAGGFGMMAGLGWLFGLGASGLTGLALVLGWTLAGSAVGAWRLARAEVRERLDDLHAHREALLRSTRAHEQRYAELQRAKSEVDEKVEQRSAELARHERLAALGSTAAAVAHQVRNPLTVLVTGLPAMRARLGDRVDAATAELIAMMLDCAQRIERLTADLLDVSRIDREHEGDFRPGAGLAAAVRLLRARAPHDVTIDAAIDEQAVLHGRAGDVTHALSNVLDNALLAAGPRGRVRISGTREARGDYVVSIEDSGPGVPEALRERIFEPFWTTRPAGEGTGLGLAICHDVITRHAGTVQVGDSELGGARFEIRIQSLTAARLRSR